MSDTLEIFGRTYPAAEGIKAYDSDGNLLTFTRGNNNLITRTVTPTESQQIVSTTYVDIEDEVNYYLTYNGDFSNLSYLNIGTTYHCVATLNRIGKNRYYSVDKDFVWNGFGSTSISLTYSTNISETLYFNSTSSISFSPVSDDGEASANPFTLIITDLAAGFSSITVNGIDSNYIGSTVQRKSSSDLELNTEINDSGAIYSAKVTAPSGYYSSDAVYNLGAGKAKIDNTSITSNPDISIDTSTGLITSTVNSSKNITPYIWLSGYVSTSTDYHNCDAGTVTASGSNTSQLSTQAGTTIIPTESEQTAVTANKYTLGVVKVGAIPSDYVGSGIEQNDSTDLTVSGATVTAPAGFYTASASKSVTSGTEGTPTATKGTVSNHSISVTPSVTNTAGYITGGTKTGTAVTITASELTSGNKAIVNNGNNIDVVEYSTVSVNVEPEDFIVTLSYNSTTEMWEPDCTYSSILAAYNNEKHIVLRIGTSDAYADGYIHPFNLNVFYRVYEDYYDSSTESNGVNTTFYVYNSSGLTNEGNYISYDTYDADTVASSVPSGNIFYNSTGRAIGTAPSRSSTDLTASGATVTAPAGFYSSAATKTISSGTATPASSISATGATLTTGTNTLTLSKTVSNTPQVSAGYVSSGTAGNSNVSLTASVNTRDSSDLTASGDTVTVPSGYYGSQVTKAVSAGSEGTPIATKGTVSDHSISVTPSVTNTGGYITGGAKTGTAVTVTASELASGNKAIIQNGTNIDVIGYSTVSVAVPTNTVTISDVANTTGVTCVITT